MGSNESIEPTITYEHPELRTTIETFYEELYFRILKFEKLKRLRECRLDLFQKSIIFAAQLISILKWYVLSTSRIYDLLKILLLGHIGKVISIVTTPGANQALTASCSFVINL